jgi:molybdate transport system substrate-binding protein
LTKKNEMTGRRLLLAVAGGVVVTAVLELWLGDPSPPDQERLLIAAAASTSHALQEVARAFEEARSIRIRLTLGSTGSLYAQILNGAPFDVFLSADRETPERLVTAKKGESNDLFVYARGDLVAWVPGDSPLAGEPSLAVALTHPSVAAIAIAHPDHAPYGRAAVTALRAIGLYDRLQSKLVLGENVAQAAHFVQSGAAQIGILARPLVVSPAHAARGVLWEVPAETYPAIDHAGLVLRSAETRGRAGAARDLRSWLTGAEGQALLARHGFRPLSAGEEARK